MKRTLLFLPSFLFGAYIGNPANPIIMNTGFFSASYPFIKGTSGYIYDYTSNQPMESDLSDASLKKFSLHSQLASFSMILVERIELFGYAGSAKEQAENNNNSNILFDLISHYHFAWGAGAKAVLIQWGQTYLSCDVTYFTVPSSNKSFFKFFDQLNLPFTNLRQTFYLNQWQLSGGISSRFYFFTPYAGVTYLNSRLHIAQQNEIGPFNYSNKNRLGYFYGLTLSLTGRFHLNFERRVRDEFAYTFSTIAVF